MTTKPQSEETSCDYRNKECATYGVTIGGKWICNNHVCEQRQRCWLNANTCAPASAAPIKHYFCSCGGALTAEEYITHFFELGHDRGDPAVAASAAPVVDNLEQVIADVIRHHHTGRTHSPTYCCPEDEPFYDRQLVRMLVEKLTAAATAAPQPSDAEAFVRQWISTLQDESHVTDEDVEDLVLRIIAYKTTAAAPVEQSEHDSCSHWREGDSDNCLLCGDDLGPATDTATLNQIKRICDLGSAREFGDALKRLESIRKLIDAHEGAR